MESVAFIQWCLQHLNYWVITLLMAIESSFIPFPSEVVIPPAAWLAATGSDLNVVLVVVFATIGAAIGASVNYFLAMWLGRPVVYAFANSRFGHMCLIDQKKVEKAEAYFDKHGAIGTLIGRLIPAVRQLISIPAGLARMNYWKFIAYTSLGAGIWNCVLAAIGYSLKGVCEDQKELTAMATKYSHELGYCIIELAVVVVAILVWKGSKKSHVA